MKLTILMMMMMAIGVQANAHNYNCRPFQGKNYSCKAYETNTKGRYTYTRNFKLNEGGYDRFGNLYYVAKSNTYNDDFLFAEETDDSFAYQHGYYSTPKLIISKKNPEKVEVHRFQSGGPYGPGFMVITKYNCR